MKSKETKSALGEMVERAEKENLSAHMNNGEALLKILPIMDKRKEAAQRLRDSIHEEEIIVLREYIRWSNEEIGKILAL